MIRRLPVLIALFSLFLMVAPALAPVKAQPLPGGRGIGARIMRQQRRIDERMASGALSPRDAHILRSNLERIRAMAADMRAASGGVLLPRQRARLNRMLDRNSAMISGRIPAMRF